MAISASWKDGTERTEFAVEFNDQVGRLLCSLSKYQSALLCRLGTPIALPECAAPQTGEVTIEETVVAEAKRAGLLLEALYGHQLPRVGCPSAFLFLFKYSLFVTTVLVGLSFNAQYAASFPYSVIVRMCYE